MNIYENIPGWFPDEKTDVLYENPDCRIERVLSYGQATPEGKWYDQEEQEWIVLLEGTAKLLMFPDEEIFMRKGDTFFIEARRRHRVVFTSENPACVWLCIFFKC
jgi:cupin 2 domain-containing protein